jgi:hypothetical protein
MQILCEYASSEKESGGSQGFIVSVAARRLFIFIRSAHFFLLSSGHFRQWRAESGQTLGYGRLFRIRRATTQINISNLLIDPIVTAFVSLLPSQGPITTAIVSSLSSHGPMATALVLAMVHSQPSNNDLLIPPLSWKTLVSHSQMTISFMIIPLVLVPNQTKLTILNLQSSILVLSVRVLVLVGSVRLSLSHSTRHDSNQP